MANIFSNLPAPAGDGSGAGVDVSTMGRERTITVQDAFRGTVVVEFSNEAIGGPWNQLLVFNNPGKRTISIAAQFMRVTRKNVPTVNPGLPNVDVSSNDNGSLAVALPSPPSTGTGASIDVSALGTFNTITCLGTFEGSVIVEISEDGINWAQCMVFTQPDWQSKNFVAQFMRVRRDGIPASVTPGTPNVDVCAINDAVSGTSGSAVDRLSAPEKWNTNNVLANQLNAQMEALVSQNFPVITAVRAGSIVGMATQLSEAVTDATADALVVRPTINGAPATLQVSHSSGTNPSGGEATQAGGVDSYVAGDEIGMEYDSLASFTPTTTDLEAWLELQNA